MMTECFDIFPGVFNEIPLPLFLFIICSNYELQNGFTQKKAPKSWQYSAETLTDADNGNDRTHLTNTPTQAESL